MAEEEKPSAAVAERSSTTASRGNSQQEGSSETVTERPAQRRAQRRRDGQQRRRSNRGRENMTADTYRPDYRQTPERRSRPPDDSRPRYETSSHAPYGRHHNSSTEPAGYPHPDYEWGEHFEYRESDQGRASQHRQSHYVPRDYTQPRIPRYGTRFDYSQPPSSSPYSYPPSFQSPIHSEQYPYDYREQYLSNRQALDPYASSQYPRTFRSQGRSQYCNERSHNPGYAEHDVRHQEYQSTADLEYEHEVVHDHPDVGGMRPEAYDDRGYPTPNSSNHAAPRQYCYRPPRH